MLKTLEKPAKKTKVIFSFKICILQKIHHIKFDFRIAF